MKIIESQNYPRAFLIQLVHYTEGEPNLGAHLEGKYLVNVLGSAHSKFSTHRYTLALHGEKEARDVYRKVKVVLDKDPQSIIVLSSNLDLLGFGTYDSIVLQDPDASSRIIHRRS